MEKIDSKSSDVGVEAIENVKVQSSATPMSSMLAKMLLNLKSDSQPSLMSPLPDLTPAISNIVEATHISEASNAKVHGDDDELASPREDEQMSDNSDEPKDNCNCRKSRCLKLYCQCFTARIWCSPSCRCISCANTTENANLRDEAVKSILMRNPNAFDSKFKSSQIGVVPIAHKVGCRCRKSMCLKKYCECFQGAVPCSAACTCLNCQNTVGVVATAPLPSLDTSVSAAASSSSSSGGSYKVLRSPGDSEEWLVTAALDLAGLRSKRMSPSSESSNDDITSKESSPSGSSATSAGAVATAAPTDPSEGEGFKNGREDDGDCFGEPGREQDDGNDLITATGVFDLLLHTNRPPTGPSLKRAKSECSDSSEISTLTNSPESCHEPQGDQARPKMAIVPLIIPPQASQAPQASTQAYQGGSFASPVSIPVPSILSRHNSFSRTSKQQQQQAASRSSQSFLRPPVDPSSSTSSLPKVGTKICSVAHDVRDSFSASLNSFSPISGTSSSATAAAGVSPGESDMGARMRGISASPNSMNIASALYLLSGVQ